MLRLVTIPRITSQIRVRILASFLLHHMCWRNHVYFLFFTPNVRHCSVMYIYENDTMPNIGICQASVCALAPATDISPLCSPVPQAVKGHCRIHMCCDLLLKNLLICDCYGIRTCVTLYLPITVESYPLS